MDVELARRRRGIREQEEQDSGPDQNQEDVEATVSIEEQAAQAVEAIADGGEILQSDGGRDVQEQRLLANEIACDLVAIDDIQDFEPWCAVVRDVQESIVTEWAHAERRGRDREQATDQELLVVE